MSCIVNNVNRLQSSISLYINNEMTMSFIHKSAHVIVPTVVTGTVLQLHDIEAKGLIKFLTLQRSTARHVSNTQ